MPNRFAAGKKAIAECDRCGQRYLLKKLKTEIVKLKPTGLLVCPQCWTKDHPQLQLGMYPVSDPQAVRNPRRDTTYYQSGVNAAGNISGGSRDIQWGWNPVGMSSETNTPNDLPGYGEIGTVTVTTT